MASPVVQNEKQQWSYQDYAQLDDDKRHEVIRGELLLAPSPGSFHQQVSTNLILVIGHHVKIRRLGQVFAAPLDVILDQQNVVQPDLVFVTSGHSSRVQPHGIVGVPDAVIEIISAASVQRDRLLKKDLYEYFGVGEYWLVDPGNRTIEIFVLAKGKYKPFAFAAETGQVKSKIIEGLELDLAEAFS